jgi:hypothetical protein
MISFETEPYNYCLSNIRSKMDMNRSEMPHTDAITQCIDEDKGNFNMANWRKQNKDIKVNGGKKKSKKVRRKNQKTIKKTKSKSFKMRKYRNH